MGLFNKKPPCPICGGKIGWLLPSKIEDEYICSDCYAKIDMQEEIKDHLTMQQFREYLLFYEENCRLRENFVISQKVDFGLWDTKIIFDHENHLFCMSKTPNTTVFEGKHLTSFIIKEDEKPLFKGSADGIKHYESDVPEKAMAMAAQLADFVMKRKMLETVERIADAADKDDNDYHRIHTMDIPEPFKKFNVELHLNHPYWNTIRCDMDGPAFSDTHPDAEDYVRSYKNCVEEIETLVNALREAAFPNAPVQEIRRGAGAAEPAAYQAAAKPVDAIEEIKRYKALLEEGIITDEEFQAKKKEILGI